MKFLCQRAHTCNEIDDRVFRFDLTSPYDVSTCAFANQTQIRYC